MTSRNQLSDISTVPIGCVPVGDLGVMSIYDLDNGQPDAFVDISLLEIMIRPDNENNILVTKMFYLKILSSFTCFVSWKVPTHGHT